MGYMPLISTLALIEGWKSIDAAYSNETTLNVPQREIDSMCMC